MREWPITLVRRGTKIPGDGSQWWQELPGDQTVDGLRSVGYEVVEVVPAPAPLQKDGGEGLASDRILDVAVAAFLKDRVSPPQGEELDVIRQDVREVLDAVEAALASTQPASPSEEGHEKALIESLWWAMTWIVGEARMPADVGGLPSDQEAFDKADALLTRLKENPPAASPSPVEEGDPAKLRESLDVWAEWIESGRPIEDTNRQLMALDIRRAMAGLADSAQERLKSDEMVAAVFRDRTRLFNGERVDLESQRAMEIRLVLRSAADFLSLIVPATSDKEAGEVEG